MTNIILKKPEYILGKFDPTLKKCNLTSSNKVMGNLSLLTEEYGRCYEFFRTQIFDSFGKVLGEEVFSIDGPDRRMYGYDIIVNKELRKIGARLGELLRLSSIIEMLENNVPFLEIMSKGSAVYFHSKYKFIPEIRSFDYAIIALKSISENSKKEFADFGEKADKLLEIFYSTENAYKLREARGEANKLIKKYIEQVLKNKDEYKNHPFTLGIDMKLYKEDVLGNKDFFNELFKSHGIDYKI